MSNKMWGGRFEAGPDAIMEAINVSIDVDRHLYAQDIAASKAHAAMLAAQGIIAADDAKNIAQGLDTILSEIAQGNLHVQARARRHSYECREPAVRTDRRRPRAGCIPRVRATIRWRPISGSGCATRSTTIDAALAAYQRALVDRALEHADTVMPGFTHLQTAQPVTFGHHLLAYVEMAARDRGRFADARKRLNESPLGAAALAGTSFPDRSRGHREGARLRPADGEFARCGGRSRLRARDAVGGGDRLGASVALRRGDRALDLAAGRPGQAVRQVHHRLVDHAAEAQSGCGRTGARQDRPHHRRADGAADRDEGPAAHLSKGHAGGQGRRHGRVRRAVAVDQCHDRHGARPRRRQGARWRRPRATAMPPRPISPTGWCGR